MAYIKKPAKFSHSKLNNYDGCPFRYKINYVDKHFIFSESIATDIGALLHAVEEKIFNSLKEKQPVDYDSLKDFFMNANIPKKDPFDPDGGIFGLNIIKEKYHEDFYAINDSGQSYASKTEDYLKYGIYRLENYLKENPDLEPVEAEKFFSFTYKDQILSGYIDRLFRNTKTGEYIIEDIKTKDHPFKEEDLATPLQFVIYSLALIECMDVPEDKITCAYDLPFLGIKQQGGTMGFITRGRKKLDKIFEGIESKDFTPNPNPTCYWCAFSATNPNQVEEAKGYCPYYSLWTPQNKTFQTAHKWLGMDKNDEVIEEERKKIEIKKANGSDKFNFEF